MKRFLSLVMALVLVLTAIPLTGIAAFAAGVKGDGDGDGTVSSLDVRLVLQAAAKLRTLTDAQEKALDMDNNGEINAIDTRKVLQVAAGLISYGSDGEVIIPDPQPPKDEDSDNIDQEDMRAVLALFGYEYDAEQDIYYTHLNPWQRYFGFTDLYDQAAAYTMMYYMTLKIDFQYKDLLWRLQWWKGQYGVLEGAELGVYTKKPENASSPFYKCAEDENLLKMYFEYYESVNDYNRDQPLFIREEQEHWWLTGFKFGICDPTKNVIKATLIAWDKEMADGIEEGLKNVTDKDGNPNGFEKYRGALTNLTTSNFYMREKLDDGTYKFTVVWKDAGYCNYESRAEAPENPENPEAPDTPVVPEEPETPVVPEEPETPVVPEEPETPSADGEETV